MKIKEIIDKVAIDQDKKKFDLCNIKTTDLKRITQGQIVIQAKGNEIILDTEILDYASQLRGVVLEIDKGNFETFTISGDYFSNSFEYIYRDPLLRIIYNDENIVIDVNYQEFKKEVLRFWESFKVRLMKIYPELQGNVSYREFVR